MRTIAGAAPETCHVLVVDDEPAILQAVRRELSSPPPAGFRYRYAIETFTRPQEALARAEEQAFDVVLCDYRMPEMDGLAFLQALVRRQPDCARIVLSGQTDFAALVRMINETHIYRFMPKPWSSYLLKRSVAEAIELRRAAIENRRLAGILRAHGEALPAATPAVDHLLVVGSRLDAANAVAYCLSQRGAFAEIFAAAGLEPADVSIQVSQQPLAALQLADELVYSCVIADDELPEIDGAGFLVRFREKQPDCSPILLVGAANMAGLVIALDLADAQSCLPKPWGDFELRAAVAQALIRHRLCVRNRALAEICRQRNLVAIA